MQLIQFLAAWLFPGAGQCFAVDTATADSSELDRASSSPSPSFSANAAGSGSSLSSPSSTSSSDGHSGFFNKSQSWRENPSTTPLCFGAGGGSAGRRLLRRGSRARAPPKQQQKEEEAAATMAPKVKGDVVGRYLHKVSKRLKKARSDGKGSPSSSMAAADDTARERAESVARAISYCKDTLRRGGTSRSRSRSPSPPPPPPSPSLDDWLDDRQKEIIESAAEQHCHECRDDPWPPPTTRPRRAAGWPLGLHSMSKRFKESPCPASADRDGSTAVAHGEESPHHGHGRCRGESISSLDEMEFLRTLDGDEEMINHHFITVEI